MMPHGMMPFGGGFVMVLFWGLLIVAAAFFVRWIVAQGRPGSGTPERPSDILKRRYAKGEISKEEYDRMKHDLE